MISLTKQAGTVCPAERPGEGIHLDVGRDPPNGSQVSGYDEGSTCSVVGCLDNKPFPMGWIHSAMDTYKACFVLSRGSHPYPTPGRPVHGQSPRCFSRMSGEISTKAITPPRSVHEATDVDHKASVEMIERVDDVDEEEGMKKKGLGALELLEHVSIEVSQADVSRKGSAVLRWPRRTLVEKALH